MSSKELALNWDDHHRTLVQVFEKLLDKNALVDCTIAAEGQYLKAHRVILSACSPYFELLFSQENEKNPIVILKGIKFKELKAMIDFIYRGTVKIPEDSLQDFVEAAETLQIKGLGVDDKKNNSERRTKEPLHADRRRDRISPIPRKHIRNNSLRNNVEHSSSLFLGTASKGECLPQHQVERNIPSSSSLSGITCSTLNSTVSASSFVFKTKNSRSTTGRNIPSVPPTVSMEEEELRPDTVVVKTEPFTEVFVPECEVFMDPKQDVYIEDSSLSDSGDRMTESATEDVPNQLSTNQYSSFGPKQESELGGDSSYATPQVEDHSSTPGTDEVPAPGCSSSPRTTANGEAGSGGSSGYLSRWQDEVQLVGGNQLRPLEKESEDNCSSSTEQESRGWLFIRNNITRTVTEAISRSDEIPSTTPSRNARPKRHYYANTEWPPRHKGNECLNRSAELIPSDLCYSMCGYQCSDALSKVERKVVFDQFHSLDARGQNDFLSNLMEPFYCKSVNFTAKRKRIVSYRYSVLIGDQKKTLCKSAVLNLLRINRAKLDSVRDQVTNTFLNRKNAKRICSGME